MGTDNILDRLGLKHSTQIWRRATSCMEYTLDYIIPGWI